MAQTGDPYYRHDLARVHHWGFAFHAKRCAPGILRRVAAEHVPLP